MSNPLQYIVSTEAVVQPILSVTGNYLTGTYFSNGLGTKSTWTTKQANNSTLGAGALQTVSTKKYFFFQTTAAGATAVPQAAMLNTPSLVNGSVAVRWSVTAALSTGTVAAGYEGTQIWQKTAANTIVNRTNVGLLNSGTPGAFAGSSVVVASDGLTNAGLTFSVDSNQAATVNWAGYIEYIYTGN